MKIARLPDGSLPPCPFCGGVMVEVSTHWWVERPGTERRWAKCPAAEENWPDNAHDLDDKWLIEDEKEVTDGVCESGTKTGEGEGGTGGAVGVGQVNVGATTGERVRR